MRIVNNRFCATTFNFIDNKKRGTESAKQRKKTKQRKNRKADDVNICSANSDVTLPLVGVHLGLLLIIIVCK